MNIITELDKDQAIKRMNDIDGYIKGKVFPLAVEDASTFSTFINGLQSTTKAANAALTDATKQDPESRSKLTYAAAIQRDSMYALVGRGRMTELGLNNMFRESYQVAKAAIDATRNKLAS